MAKSADVALFDTDSEDELPSGWEQRLTEEGRVYYVCHRTKETQWAHPVTGCRKKLSAELPYGWTRQVGPAGQVYFINDITLKTSITDPRLAFAVEEKAGGKDGLIRQRFDASSTALQVLLGRDLTDQYAIVTGANSGIGFETARSLALHGAHVTLACRDPQRAAQAVAAIRRERATADVRAIRIDLANLCSVRQFVSDYLALRIPLNILILNAGVFSVPYTLTPDGYESTFQTNHLGHFYLTQLLTDSLERSAPSRVVIVSAESHRFTDVNVSTISETLLSPPPCGYRPLFAYNASKMCNVLHALELHRRVSARGVHVFAVHPGNAIATGLGRHWWGWKLLFGLVRPFAKSKQQGAATTIFCATAPELQGASGHYFNNCFKCPPAAEALHPDAARLLWDISERMVAKATTLDGRFAGEGGGVRGSEARKGSISYEV